MIFPFLVTVVPRIFKHIITIRSVNPLVMEMNEEDQDTYILAEDGKLGLNELFRADILLALPTKYLCKEDCKGLCPVCGMNLNNSSCQCNKRQIDPRLEVLKQLID